MMNDFRYGFGRLLRLGFGLFYGFLLSMFQLHGATSVVTVFSNNDAMTLPTLEDGPSDPYPSDIFVSGLTAAVQKVTVTLIGVSHVFPDDLDIILVSPGGRASYVMSDAGLDVSLNGVNLTFDDSAAQFVPDDGPIVSGTYRPSNYGVLADRFNAPAPPPPYVTNFTIFNGSNPNGKWSLCVMDDLPEDFGLIQGWSLTLTTRDPIADLTLGLQAVPESAVVGSPMTYTMTVANQGPAPATGIMVTNRLPAALDLVSVGSSQGSCQVTGLEVACDLGNLLAFAQARVDIIGTPTQAGIITNRAFVFGSELDLNPANNQAQVNTSVVPAADLNVVLSGPTSLLDGEEWTVAVIVTNAGPNPASHVTLRQDLDSSLVFVSATSEQGSCSEAGGAA